MDNGKKIWFYNADMPELGMGYFHVSDEIYETDGKDYKELTGILTKWSIDSYMYGIVDIRYNLWIYGEGLYAYVNRMNKTIVLGFDEGTVKNRWYAAVLRDRDNHKRKLNKLEGLIRDVEGHN